MLDVQFQSNIKYRYVRLTTGISLSVLYACVRVSVSSVNLVCIVLCISVLYFPDRHYRIYVMPAQYWKQ